MKISEIVEGTRCWKGYKKKGMKTMFGKRVPNCVKNESEEHIDENRRDWFGKGKKMDVGIDGHPTFGVYDMDDIIRIMDKRDIVSDMLFDHHTDEVITEDGKKRK